MDWYCGEAEGTVGNSPFCTWLILPSVIQLLQDPTAMAIRVAAVTSPVSAPGGNTSILAAGIIAWNYLDDSVPNPCPGPLTECDADWMWWWAAPDVAGPVIVSANGGADTNILSKARRRLGNDQSLLLVAQTLGPVDHNFHIHARALIKE